MKRNLTTRGRSGERGDFRLAPRLPKKELVWNVFVGDFNGKRIERYNIFRHGSFYADVKKYAKKYKDDREKFEEEIKRSLMYYYWSKCEWEIILSGWPNKEGFHEEKIDVYDQVMMNWEVFINYLWENRSSAK